MELEEVFVILERERALSPELREEIRRICGERGAKALMAIDEKRVKKYRDFIVVVGTTDEYVVDEDLCTCWDFVFRKGRCWHVLAGRIAVLSGDYEEIDLWYTDTWSAAETTDKQFLS